MIWLMEPSQNKQTNVSTASIINQYICWYHPIVKETKKTFLSGTAFNVRKGLVTFYPGKLVVQEADTNNMVYELVLTSDLKLSHPPTRNFVSITYVNGQDLSTQGYTFLLREPFMEFITYRVTFWSLKVTKLFMKDCKQAAGIIES
jgi:hypothetical protein